jgi:thioredoxin 1
MIEINEANFEQETKSGLVLVDFFAPWCGPCRMLAPVLEQITDVTSAKLNTDDNTSLAVKLKISALPTVVLFKDGVEVERIVGLRSQSEIQAIVNKHKG